MASRHNISRWSNHVLEERLWFIHLNTIGVQYGILPGKALSAYELSQFCNNHDVTIWIEVVDKETEIPYGILGSCSQRIVLRYASPASIRQVLLGEPGAAPVLKRLYLCIAQVGSIFQTKNSVPG